METDNKELIYCEEVIHQNNLLNINKLGLR